MLLHRPSQSTLAVQTDGVSSVVVDTTSVTVPLSAYRP